MLKAQILPNNILSIESTTVADSVKFETVCFSFPANWANYKKTAVFKYEDKIYNVVLDEFNSLCIDENSCFVPQEVLKSPCFSVSVFGVLNDSVATTTFSTVTVLKSGYAQGDEPSLPTPDQYSQLLNIANETKNIALSVKLAAENGEFKGDKGDKGDVGNVDESLFASAIQNKVSGSAILIRNVSKLKHKVQVKLSGNVAENLLSNTLVAKPMGIDLENGDGSYLINGTVDGDLPILVLASGGTMILEQGKTYTLDLGTASDKVRILITLTNNNYTEYEELQTDGTGKLTFTVGANAIINSLLLKGDIGTVIDNLLVKPTLYESSKATDFTRVRLYRYGINSSVSKVEYTPNADGTVEVESLSPYMSLVTDKCGLNIDATYNVDTKAYIDTNTPDFTSEIWTFELEDGTTVEKAVLLG